MVRMTLAAILCATLAACASSDPDGPPKVEWGKTAARSVKADVDAQAKAKDCDGLQTAFDTAGGNKRPDLMSYIDWSMKRAGCY